MSSCNSGCTVMPCGSTRPERMKATSSRPSRRPLTMSPELLSSSPKETSGRLVRNSRIARATSGWNGAEVVNANCLMCHGGLADGKLTIGLSNATADFTRGAGGGVTDVPLTDDLLDLLGLDEAERSQLKKIGGRGAALGPLTRMRTIG